MHLPVAHYDHFCNSLGGWSAAKGIHHTKSLSVGGEFHKIGVFMHTSFLMPKNRSKGSWHILWLRKESTEGTVKTKRTNSMKDLPV